jgi:hypothetical protein
MVLLRDGETGRLLDANATQCKRARSTWGGAESVGVRSDTWR